MSSTNLEGVTAATFASVGFLVLRDLKYELDGQVVVQIDVFASLFSPLREQRLMLECKGGHPTFTEIQQFASLRRILSPAPDELVIICREGCPGNREELAADLDVALIEKPRLVAYVLPMLGGTPDRNRRARELNRYLAWQTVHEFLTNLTPSHPLLRDHYRFLTTNLWAISPAEQQVTRSFQEYQGRFNAASDIVARDKGLDPRRIVHDAADDAVEAALYVMTLHRVINAYALTRLALHAMRRQPGQYLLTAVGPSLRRAISNLSRKPRYLLGFPSFMQEFLFVWGGFIHEPNRDYEMGQIAAACDTTTDAVQHYLDVIKSTYSGGGGSLLRSWHDLQLFLYVPAAFRALGITHRRIIDPNRYAGTTFFPRAEAAYFAALDRALVSIDGASGLAY